MGAMVCANLGFTVHTLVSLLLLLQATRSQSIWRGLEELQVNILIRTIYSVVPVSPTYSHLGTVSSSHGLYSTWIFAEHIQLWNRGRSLSYGVRVE